jgi:hypothetical protein
MDWKEGDQVSVYMCVTKAEPKWHAGTVLAAGDQVGRGDGKHVNKWVQVMYSNPKQHLHTHWQGEVPIVPRVPEGHSKAAPPGWEPPQPTRKRRAAAAAAKNPTPSAAPVIGVPVAEFPDAISAVAADADKGCDEAEAGVEAAYKENDEADQELLRLRAQEKALKDDKDEVIAEIHTTRDGQDHEQGRIEKIGRELAATAVHVNRSDARELQAGRKVDTQLDALAVSTRNFANKKTDVDAARADDDAASARARDTAASQGEVT